MAFVRASQEVSSERVASLALDRRDGPDRVYVRRARHGRVLVMAWGIEHGGLRSEVVEPVVPGRPSAAVAIERDLRRGVGLF
jgi:hypothetical protein